MSYLLPCRPRCLFFTVHRSFPPAFHFQIIPVVNPRQFIFILPPRKICQISPHTITFNFTFHEKTLPTTFSASARSSRKSSSPLRRLVSNHQFNWWFIISPPKGYCYCSPQRAVSQALLLARYKAVLLESSRLDSSACSFIYF